jgi:hypothetical protein
MFISDDSEDRYSEENDVILVESFFWFFDFFDCFEFFL